MMRRVPKTTGMFTILAVANLAVWAWAWAAFHDRPTLLGTALLAWVFGLRHAVDADHIAAIDNVVRKLMQEGQRPQMVGLWFSLGHSSIVVLASLAIAATATAMHGRLEAIKGIGGVVGTLVSASFLLAIAAANLVILLGVWRKFRQLRCSGRLDEEALDTLVSGRGLLARLFRPLFRAITRSWHMYPLGFLFGLGFDTATEVGLLGISATQASQGMSPWQAMVFPALFTAGMALVDTADSVLMVGAYGWAFVNPLRKLWYNLTITAASVLVALLIGGVETLGLMGDQLALTGPFWEAIGDLNDSFGYLGFAVVGIFIICWAASTVIYRWRGYVMTGTVPMNHPRPKL
ncbi:MAG: HoxN/HupN/NixA family nickel/cobalt transporter [Acetobacteraceae bacterium]|nr:HoxN/HupN/NixA family nickel/cobalt transporter [Acetobacteraceae bacterium]